MAKSIALDEYGDVIFPLRWVEDVDEVVQLAHTKVLKIYDEDVYALETGIDYFGVMLNVQATNEQRALEVKRPLLLIPEVNRLESLTIQDPGSDGVVGIAFGLDTIYGNTGLVNP